MKTVTTNLDKLLHRWEFWIFILTTAPFVWLPKLDLKVSHLFFANGHFYWAQSIFAVVIYELFLYLKYLIIPMLLGPLIWLYRRKSHISHQQKLWRKRLLFLALSLAIGPGIIGNVILKDHSLGRPRPYQVYEFGGQDQFSPVLQYSGQCHRNCSFISGHAALAFYFIALAWALGKPRLLYVGITLGLIVGFIRIIQGGHFLSDVTFAFWVDYLTCLILARAFHYPSLVPSIEFKFTFRSIY